MRPFRPAKPAPSVHSTSPAKSAPSIRPAPFHPARPARSRRRAARNRGAVLAARWPLTQGPEAVKIVRISPAAKGRSLPPHWAALEPQLRKLQGGLEEPRSDAANILRLRQLVLQAKALPYILERGQLFVPLFLLPLAVGEISAFEREGSYSGYLARLEENRPHKENWLWVLLCLTLLSFWHSLRYRAAEWGLNFLPYRPEGWVEAGALKNGLAQSGEWWRCFTALTLHADAAHLLSNILFGAMFLLLLCRRTGLGPGLFVTIFSAAAANAANSFFQSDYSFSLGFSTAVFAALGALCGLSALHLLGRRASGPGLESGDKLLDAALAAHAFKAELRGIFVSLAVGVAFLAFIGGSGVERVDFSAHAWGFAAGALFIFAPGLAVLAAGGRQAAWRFYQNINGGFGLPVQALLLVLTFLALCAAWHQAFAAYWK